LYHILIPYDGKDIGTFTEDAMRRLQGELKQQGNRAGLGVASGIFRSEGSTCPAQYTTANQVPEKYIFDNDLVTPTSYENCPASNSYLACVTY